jgi:hypothetical protein
MGGGHAGLRPSLKLAGQHFVELRPSRRVRRARRHEGRGGAGRPSSRSSVMTSWRIRTRPRQVSTAPCSRVTDSLHGEFAAFEAGGQGARRSPMISVARARNPGRRIEDGAGFLLFPGSHRPATLGAYRVVLLASRVARRSSRTPRRRRRVQDCARRIHQAFSWATRALGVGLRKPCVDLRGGLHLPGASNRWPQRSSETITLE